MQICRWNRVRGHGTRRVGIQICGFLRIAGASQISGHAGGMEDRRIILILDIIQVSVARLTRLC